MTQNQTENISVSLLDQALLDNVTVREKEKDRAVRDAQAYFKGYSECTEAIRGMIRNPKYESTDMTPKSYVDGANEAFYLLSKELGIQSRDIREMDISIEQKATLLAENFRQLYSLKGQ